MNMKIETKYSIGDTVWFLDGYRAQSSKITGIEVQVLGTSKPFVQYRFCVFPPIKEEHAFKTKEELIKYIEK